jgi:hypothetical protein
MKAIHVNWTKPFFNKKTEYLVHNDTKHYSIDEYTFLYTLLSVLNWKRFNGSIDLYTDIIGSVYYDRIGLSNLYDNIYITLDDANYRDDLWIAAKVHSICKHDGDFVFLDNDLIIRESIHSNFYNCDVGILHWEFENDTYLERCKEYYTPSIKWNSHLLSNNASFFYISNKIQHFKDIWYEELQRFNTIPIDNIPINTLTLLDQYVPTQLFDNLNLNVNYLDDRIFTSRCPTVNTNFNTPMWVYSDSIKTKFNTKYEHIWFSKRNTDNSKMDEWKYEIIHNFSEYKHLLDIWKS